VGKRPKTHARVFLSLHFVLFRTGLHRAVGNALNNSEGGRYSSKTCCTHLPYRFLSVPVGGLETSCQIRPSFFITCWTVKTVLPKNEAMLFKSSQFIGRSCINNVHLFGIIEAKGIHRQVNQFSLWWSACACSVHSSSSFLM